MIYALIKSLLISLDFAIECFENGLINRKDTGGIELTWGNDEAIVAMTKKMAKREGFGGILADGVGVSAGKIGKEAERYAIHIQGQERLYHQLHDHIVRPCAIEGADRH